MSCALVQTKLTSVPPEKLRKAFRELPQLLDQDADSMARDAYGVLVDGLSREDARTLQTALERLDVGTKVVDEEDLPDLPPARKVRYAECLEEDFRFRHPEGTTYEMGWRTIIGVAAGAVRMEEWERERKRDTKIQAVAGGRMAMPVPRWHTESSSEWKHRPLIDVFSATREPRIRIRGDRFQYEYLGDRMRNTAAENFRLLVGDLVKGAETNFVNRGARDILKDPEAPLRKYPNMHAFDEEIVWLFYRRSIRGGS